MILLEKGNRILQETVNQVINRDPDETPTQNPLDVRLHDFDDESYRVEVRQGEETKLKISMRSPIYHDIEEFGGKAALEKEYPGMLSDPASDYHVAIDVDLTKLPEEEEKRDELVKKLACLKGTLNGGMYRWYFEALNNDTIMEKKAAKHDCGGGCEVYFFPRPDRVVVVFGLDFKNEQDTELAKIFLQEFADTRRKITSAPPTSFDLEGPSELKEGGFSTDGKSGGFISFAILKSHLGDDKKMDHLIHCLASFRSFFQYHLKMSKSHFHSRMRKRTQSLLKVLNRAKVTDPKVEKKKKTASGKTFNR